MLQKLKPVIIVIPLILILGPITAYLLFGLFHAASFPQIYFNILVASIAAMGFAVYQAIKHRKAIEKAKFSFEKFIRFVVISLLLLVVYLFFKFLSTS